MTGQDRKAPGGAAATATSAAGPTNGAAAHQNGRNGDAAGSLALRWEDWFQSASADQRSAMLELAGAHKGLLYVHQVPPAANGVKARSHVESSVPSPAPPPALTALLAGKIDELAPVVTGPLEFVDTHLDEMQREAVARAIFT